MPQGVVLRVSGATAVFVALLPEVNKLLRVAVALPSAMSPSIKPTHRRAAALALPITGSPSRPSRSRSRMDKLHI